MFISLLEHWHARGNFRKNSAAYNALTVMFKMQFFSIEKIRFELDVFLRPLLFAVKILIDAKIIKERT